MNRKVISNILVGFVYVRNHASSFGNTAYNPPPYYHQHIPSSFNKMLHQHYIRKFTGSFYVTGLAFRSLSGIVAECLFYFINCIFLIFS
jgi:hypothetical protein